MCPCQEQYRKPEEFVEIPRDFLRVLKEGAAKENAKPANDGISFKKRRKTVRTNPHSLKNASNPY